ncbi:MAG: hypothetical protein Q9M14_02160 [Mariprofundaceae bacterium]|nr:hypothetical protein [Mariprofundaceae bacterium]
MFKKQWMSCIGQAQLRVILMSLTMIMVFPSGLWAETMNQWTINMQDKADNYARWLDNPPKRRAVHNDALMMRKFIYTCTMLKAYSSNDWCSSSSLTKRWLGYANKNGFDLEMRGYEQTTAGNFLFPQKILDEINKAASKKKR